MSRCAATIALVVALLLPTTAEATHVRCGDVITQDTRLDSHLIECPFGLVIGGANVTLDLAGHTIDGTGEPDAVGVYSAFPGTTVKRGTISDYDPAVRIEADDGTVERLNALGGVRFVGDGFTLARSLVPAAERAVGGAGSGATIARNRVEMAGGVCEGFRLLLTDSLIARNTATGHGCEGTGLAVEGDANTVERNKTTGWCCGIVVDGASLVRRNVANGADLIGITASPDAIDGGRNRSDSGCVNVRC